MDRRQIATKLTLDALGQDLVLADFDDRLILQKTVYLVQAAGVNLGHAFRWYLRGPYSKHVTSDAFSMKEELDAGLDESLQWKLDEESRQRLEPLKGLLAQRPGEDKNAWALRLELLASVRFLVDTNQGSRSTPEGINGIEQKLGSFGKDFSAQEIEAAFADLDAHCIPC